jgi:restriction endonuclease Mrr
MIPEFQMFMLPFLEFLKDGKEHSLKECVEAISSGTSSNMSPAVEELGTTSCMGY